MRNVGILSTARSALGPYNPCNTAAATSEVIDPIQRLDRSLSIWQSEKDVGVLLIGASKTVVNICWTILTL